VQVSWDEVLSGFTLVPLLFVFNAQNNVAARDALNWAIRPGPCARPGGHWQPVPLSGTAVILMMPVVAGEVGPAGVLRDRLAAVTGRSLLTGL
jgi:hypothetical protein